jgi:hypothetical protein
MKRFALLVALSLAALTVASPLPEGPVPIAEGDDAVFRGIRAATEEEVLQVFGYRTFDAFLASEVSKDSKAPSSIFRRSTVSICQTGHLFEDAQTAIYRLASAPSNLRCGNTETPPGCTIMQRYNGAVLGFCGPTTTSILCSKIALYLFGIANTCRYNIVTPLGQAETHTGGYQGLNENILNYVFVN